MEWIRVEDRVPPENVYILANAGEGCPIFVTRLVDNEWDTGANYKRPCYLGKNMFKTSAPAVYWMPLPRPPKKEE